MDALKKAELAKRKAQPDNASSQVASPPTQPRQPAADYRLPATQGKEAAQLPNLPEHMEMLDLQFETDELPNKAAVPESSPKRIPTAAASLSLQDTEPPFLRHAPAVPPSVEPENSEREAVQNLFETKQAAPSRKLFGIAVGVATLCAVAAIGLYFWTELQPKSSLVASRPNPNNPTTAAAKPIGSVTAAPTATTAPLPAVPEIAGLIMRDNNVEPSIKEENTIAAEAAKPPETRTAIDSGKKLFRVSASPEPSTQTLDRAYDALARGDNEAAKVAYTQALNNDPRNPDALSGLAVIAQQSGNNDAAANYYLQMLDGDPKNATAMAGLMNLQSRMDPAVAEIRLKQALANQPDSAPLNFSLGNLYSRGKRWSDAQQAYFKAVAGDPGNPDYLFNLAVSLDQMHQPKLAEKYYVQAIAAAVGRPAGFDKNRVDERLQKLQQQP